jgi:tetratricopeptide (TPR) repeat protein
MNVASLHIVGEAMDQTIDLHEQKVQIGRGRDNDIVLPDANKGVSRVHAELRYENGRYVIVDLQSQNGTWLNGRRVERAEVPPGAEIAVGEYRLTLQAEGKAGDGTTVRVPPPQMMDELRMRERPAEEALAARAAAAPSANSRWLVPALSVTAIVVLAGVAWVSTSGRHPAQAPSTAGVPPAAPADQPSRDAAALPPPSAATDAAAARPHDVAEPVEAAAPVKQTPAPVVDGTGARVGRRPGESTDAWRARAAALQMRYGYSKAALERGDYAAAAGGFEAILVEEPGFMDAPQLLVEAQAGLRASARNLYRAGAKLDAAGDWLGALQKYEQARQISPGIPGLAESLQRVREKLHAAGTSAFNRARQLEASGRVQEAVKEYEKAIQWLPSSDPNRYTAQTKVEQLRRN